MSDTLLGSPDDRWGCQADLREALSHPALDSAADPASPAVRAAAWELARALGRCRLFGVEPGELDGTLPVAVAIAAAEQATDVARDQRERLRTLGQRWDDARTSTEADDVAASPLEASLDLWAAFVALDEAHSAALEQLPPYHGAPYHGAPAPWPYDGAPAPWPQIEALTQVLTALAAEVESFDRELRDEIDVLSFVAHLELLNNWRAALAAPYADCQPWWLDGSLEARARRIERESRESLPPTELFSPAAGSVSADDARQVQLVARLQLPAPADQVVSATSETASSTAHLAWRAPGDVVARPARLTIRLLPPLGARAPVYVMFPANAAPAGTLVRLGALASRIDERGRAAVTYGALFESWRGDPDWTRLQVGEPAVEWFLEPAVEESR